MTVLISSIVLAMYPNVSGMGYAVFEGHLIPVDWGIKTARMRKDITLIRHANRLLELFKPSALLLPLRSTAIGGAQRLHKIAVEIEALGKTCGASIHWYRRSDIKASFSRHGAQSKDAIARNIAQQMPEFEQHLPPLRKIWMSEDYRMGIFDAVALAVTYYENNGLEKNL